MSISLESYAPNFKEWNNPLSDIVAPPNFPITPPRKLQLSSEVIVLPFTLMYAIVLSHLCTYAAKVPLLTIGPPL